MTHLNSGAAFLGVSLFAVRLSKPQELTGCSLFSIHVVALERRRASVRFSFLVLLAASCDAGYGQENVEKKLVRRRPAGQIYLVVLIFADLKTLLMQWMRA